MRVSIVVVEFRNAVSEDKLDEVLYAAFGRGVHICTEDTTIRFERE